jgi:hypothetical protein
MPITPPNVSAKRELARKLFDAFLSQIPLAGGPLSALYSVTYPAKGEVDEAKWRQDVSNTINCHEDVIRLLVRSISLTEDASFLGKWIAEASSNGGRSDIRDYDQIVAQFPGSAKLQILEAVGELELEGMVIRANSMSKPFSHLRPTHKLFEVFDPIIFPDVSPRQDAAKIAAALLESENGVSAPDLCERYGWTLRRINPALSIVAVYISDGRKSSPIGQEYVVREMFEDAKERAMLRRFVSEVHGD